MHREELKKEIDDKSEEIIRKLKEKEEKCKLNAQKLEKINLNELKNDTLPYCKQKFRIPELKQDELNDLLSKMHKNIDYIQFYIKKFKKELLLNESIKFEKFENENLFGKLIITNLQNILATDCGKLIREYKRHSEQIRSIQVIENFNKLISTSADSTIKIWNFETGECLKTLNDHKNVVTSILMITNNKFVSSSADTTIKIWDLISYECLNTLTIKTGVYSLSLLPNNEIACGCLDGSIHIWNLENSIEVKTFKAHNDWIPILILFEKVKLISCSGEKDKTIKIWNSVTFECIRIFEGHSDGIYHIELTLDGNLFSGSLDKTVKLWQIETGKLLKSIAFEHQVNCVKTLNEDLIAIGLQNGEIKLYDLSKGETIKTIPAHNTIFKLNFVSNTKLLSGSRDGEIKLWKIFE